MKIRNSIIFNALNDAEYAQVSGTLRELALKTGDQLYAEGDNADTLSIVLDGELRAVKRAADGSEVTLGEFGASEIIGEMALVADFNRSATVVAEEPCRLVVLRRDTFDQLVATQPAVAFKIMRGIARSLSQHLRDTSADLADEFL